MIRIIETKAGLWEWYLKVTIYRTAFILAALFVEISLYFQSHILVSYITCILIFSIYLSITDLYRFKFIPLIDSIEYDANAIRFNGMNIPLGDLSRPIRYDPTLPTTRLHIYLNTSKNLLSLEKRIYIPKYAYEKKPLIAMVKFINEIILNRGSSGNNKVGLMCL